MAKKQQTLTGESPAIESPEIVDLSPSIAQAEVELPPVDGPCRFRVSLPHYAALEVEATDRDAAVARFNELAGVLSTSHQYSVEPLSN